MSTNVNYDNIRDLLYGVAGNLKTKIAAIDLTQAQKDMLVKLDKIIKTGIGTSFLSDNGTYKNIPIDQIQNMLDKLTTIYSLFGITNVVEHWDNTGILNMITARYGLTSQIYNGKIYCIGGVSNSGTNLDKVEIYDIASNTWTSGAVMLTARGYLTSVLYNGKIYCIGGIDNNSGNYSNKVEIYDIFSNTWTSGTNMLTARLELTSQIYNGKIYCIGGHNASNLNKVEIYDISSNTWTTGTAMTTVRYGLSSVIYNSNIYCMGGNNGSYLNKVEIYDIVNNTWSTINPMLTNRAFLTSQIYNGNIYCMGGWVTNYSNKVDVYNIANNTWSNDINNIPNIKRELTSVLYNNKIYCIGGDNGSALNIVEVLWLANISYTIATPTDITAKLATLVNTGTGTKLLTDNGTYQEYIATGYRELTTTELATLTAGIKTAIS